MCNEFKDFYEIYISRHRMGGVGRPPCLPEAQPKDLDLCDSRVSSSEIPRLRLGMTLGGGRPPCLPEARPKDLDLHDSRESSSEVPRLRLGMTLVGVRLAVSS